MEEGTTRVRLFGNQDQVGCFFDDFGYRGSLKVKTNAKEIFDECNLLRCINFNLFMKKIARKKQ